MSGVSELSPAPEEVKTSVPVTEPVKKVKTLMPMAEEQRDSSDSESEEETRVINDIDYEALEDIWLKAGEMEAKDMSFSDKKRKKTKEWRKRRREEWSTEAGGTGTSTDTSDGEWTTDTDKPKQTSPDRRRKNYTWKSLGRSPGRSDALETEISASEPPATMVTSPRKPLEQYMFPLAAKSSLPAGPPITPTKLDKTPGGYNNAFLSFLSPGAGPAAATNGQAQSPPANPMIRRDYGKLNEEIVRNSDLKSDVAVLPGQTLHSTIEKLKCNLTNGSTQESSQATSSITSVSRPPVNMEKKPAISRISRILDLLLHYGLTPHMVTTLQKTNNALAVERLLSKAAKMNQLQAAMSPTHRQTLSMSGSAQGSSHRSLALNSLALLPMAQVDSLEAGLVSLTEWTGELGQQGFRWELSVKPPAIVGARKSFIIEKRQLRELDLDTNNCKLHKSSRYVRMAFYKGLVYYSDFSIAELRCPMMK